MLAAAVGVATLHKTILHCCGVLLLQSGAAAVLKSFTKLYQINMKFARMNGRL
jgi:hypothetical protein